MKKKPKPTVERMRARYDFSAGVRGKYSRKLSAGSHVVVLEPDVAKAFPDSAAVNEALRDLLRSRKRRKP
jgi:hypothetical protein